MNIKDLKEYIEFMKEHELSELEVQDGDKKIRLKKDSCHAMAVMPAPQMMAAQGGMQVPPAKAGAAEGMIEIKSPMVGTFYRSPSPEAASYAEIGTDVNPDSVVCIIEAMKVMNEIKAEVKGVVTQVLVENGKPVEFGQPLFKVRPA